MVKDEEKTKTTFGRISQRLKEIVDNVREYEIVARMKKFMNPSDEQSKDQKSEENEALQKPDLNNLSTYVDLFRHWDNSYWTASYVFLVIQGALIAALTQLRTLKNDNSWLIITSIFSFFGLGVSVSMMLVLNRKRTYTQGAEKYLKNWLPEMYKEITRRQIGFRCKYSSAEIMQKCLPVLFVVFWFIVALLSIAQYFYPT